VRASTPSVQEDGQRWRESITARHSFREHPGVWPLLPLPRVLSDLRQFGAPGRQCGLDWKGGPIKLVLLYGWSRCRREMIPSTW